ncbi:MAG: hypothetical protein OXQ92_03470, partial [Boseongicola sp.]|nr:hypothetical protein [Boseongicola sp.]
KRYGQMALLEEVSDALAKRTIELMERTGDENIEKRVAEEIGSSSPTLQENYSTAVRIRKAEARANKLLDKYMRGEDIPVAQISAQPQDDGGH